MGISWSWLGHQGAASVMELGGGDFLELVRSPGCSPHD